MDIMHLIPFAVGLAVLAVLVVALVTLVFGSGSIGKYRARSLMTDNELEFFYKIKRALPDHLVFPQVSLQAFMEAASSDAKTAHADRLRIAQQRADYVVCDPAGTVVVVIELDDKTHVPEKDAVRDARLKQAGIRTLRYQSKAKPRAAAIREDVLGRQDAASAQAPEAGTGAAALSKH